MRHYRLHRFVVLAFSLIGMSPTVATAAPNVWVCTMAVDAYTYLLPESHLKWCTNDARRFVERLKGCGLIEGNGKHLLEFVATGKVEQALSSGERFDPTADNIRSQLPRFLSQAAEGDTVIIYAAMHGASVPGAEPDSTDAFLLPVDFKSSQIEKSAISMRWLRKQLLQGSKARTVLLFLDACHSGGIGAATGRDWDMISTRTIGVLFGNDEKGAAASPRNVYTLVSCADNQKSAEYVGFKQGVFSFWLGVGLDGAADSNGDELVTMDELFQFVSTQVPITTRYLHTKDGKPIDQLPQRFLLGSNQNNPTLFKLPVLNSARPALNRAALLLHSVLENFARGISAGHSIPKPRVFISEFSDESLLGGRLGSFGAVARGLLEETLMLPQSRSNSAYAITTQSALRPQLKGVELPSLISDTGSVLPKSKPGAEILVHGAFLRITDALGDRLQLKLQITNLLDGTSIASVPITFQLNDDIWNLLPVSQDVKLSLATKPAPDKPQPSINASTTVYASTTVAVKAPTASPVFQAVTTEQLAKQPHPLRRPDATTIAVEIYQGSPGSNKQLVQWLPEEPDNPNLLAFETEAGQELEIRIRNSSDKNWRAVIVQIDGLNQIGTKPQFPSEAHYWLLPPCGEARIDQWLDVLPAQAANTGNTFMVEGNKLVVTSPPDSIAGRQKLFDNLGEIRILAFGTEMVPPNAKAAVSDVGIGRGSRSKNEFMLHRDWKIDRGQNLGSYVIRYRGKSSS